MTNRMLAAFGVALAVALALAAPAGRSLTAQAPPSLFADSAETPVAVALDGPITLRARTTTARFDLLTEALAAGAAGDRWPMFTLNLFDDAAFTVEYERFERDRFGHASWVGRVAGDPLSVVTLTWRGQVLSGRVQTRDALYRLQGADGLTVIEQIDPGSVGIEAPPLVPPVEDRITPAADVPLPLAAGEVVDVFVYYTAAARAGAGGQPQIEALIAQGVSESNTVYQRSSVLASLRLVGTSELVGFVESATNMTDDLTGFTSSSTVNATRNAVAADLMHLVVANVTAGICGIAWLGPSNTYAHGVTARGCFAQATFPHEVGHNFGNQHAPGDPVSSSTFRPYSFGYKNCGTGTRFYTVMAYPCGGASRILNLSNPGVTHTGMPTGTATQDNARSQSEAFPLVQAFRAGAPATLPGAPQSLQAVVSGNTISVSWQAPATGTPVATYIVQAGTSPGASNVYSGGVGPVTAVSSPIANGTYYLRVIAQNTAGTGPASAEVVAQVGTPPGPPQAVTATAAAGVISLSWLPPATGGAVSGYVVQAGTTSGAANIFNGAVGAGTAVSGAVAPGTYFLRVFAQGPGGTSTASNEASLAVGPACTSPEAPALSGSLAGSTITISWTTPAGGPVGAYTVLAGSASGASNLFNASVGLTNTVSAPVGPGSYFIRVVANAACGASAASNEVTITVP